METILANSINECLEAMATLQKDESKSFIKATAGLLAETFKNGHKVIIAGNGGSLCDAAHFAEELTGIFRAYRPALPAIVLSEPGHITCVGNDLGFEWVFARSLEALGQPGDVFVGLTTSGNSPNLIRAFETAKSKGMKSVAFLGKDGGRSKGMADIEWIVNGFKNSDRIQEAHMAVIHILIELVEILLFPGQGALKNIIKPEAVILGSV